MNQNEPITRRSLLRIAGAATALSIALPSAAKPRSAKALSFNNADFYTAKGVLKQDAAKQAYIELMRFHGYPVFPGIEKRLNVLDFGRGQLALMGVAVLGFLNELEGCYNVQDIFLLPNQYLPEHYHEATADCPAKMEGWTVRYGQCIAGGEGPASKPMRAVISPKLNTIITARHETVLNPGQTAHLKRATAPHWLYAGPQGAIITEAASYHDPAGMRFTDTKLK